MKNRCLSIFARFVVCAGLIAAVAACGAKPEPADLILKNGKLITVDESRPEARALAVSDGRITAVGTDREIERYVGEDTQVIDLEGHTAIPGFIDSHAHFTSIGQARLGLDLTKARSWPEIVALVEAAAEKAAPGEWIVGRGWHQEKWDEAPEPNVAGLPYHGGLSRISPENPVLLNHASGHSSFANAKAMELAGVTAQTEAPEGGEIVRDPRGRPIGVFRETAQRLLRHALYSYLKSRTPEQIAGERVKVVELADGECLAKGITSLHDAGASFETIDFFKRMIDEDKLHVRLYVMVNESNPLLLEKLNGYRIDGYGDHHLTVRSIKRLIDGALGAHGAWLLEPYLSLPESSGLNTESIEVMRETARIAIEQGFQLNTHAIGDRGNRETLDLYQAAFLAHPGKSDLRWRIEHSQHLHPEDIPRFAGLGVIPSMQGIHCISDGPWVLKRLGEKRAEEGAYMWRDLISSGAVICNGTDAPVEDVDPIPSYFASVSRRLKDGSLFYPRQRMTREEALRSYTLNGAYAAFEEDLKGSLTVGKLADITVLSKDLMTVAEDEILETEVLYTIIGGKVLFRK